MDNVSEKTESEAKQSPIASNLVLRHMVDQVVGLESLTVIATHQHQLCRRLTGHTARPMTIIKETPPIEGYIPHLLTRVV